jgi:hypothetical protein
MDDPKSFAKDIMERDPDLQDKIAALIAQHEADSREIPDAVHQYPRYVFSRDSDTGRREPGGIVKVRNGLDEQLAGGTIIEKVGRAYRVRIEAYDLIAIVHEPDDSWE